MQRLNYQFRQFLARVDNPDLGAAERLYAALRLVELAESPKLNLRFFWKFEGLERARRTLQEIREDDFLISLGFAPFRIWTRSKILKIEERMADLLAADANHIRDLKRLYSLKAAQQKRRKGFSL